MSKRRTSTWLTVILGIAALLALGIPGLLLYLSSTGTLHSKPEELPSVTQTTPPARWTGAVERARQIAREALVKQNLPGISVAVGRDGQVVWAEGFGFADLETRQPVTPNHQFRIGTASTVLTSAAAGLLVEQGRLQLDAEIQTYVPAFPKQQWPVTLRQVMAHTSGIPTDGGDEGPLFSEHCEQPTQALTHFATMPLLFEPGTRYRYSRYGWILVSAAIESAAGKPFLTFLREQVFDPLGMHETLADDATKALPERVTPYFPRFAANPAYGLHLMRDLDYSCYAGASVFVSTPSDLVRFGMGINGGKLLKRQTVQTLQTSQRLPSGEETGYGLGWDLGTVDLAGKQAPAAGHDGDSLGGTVASLVTFPERGMVVAVLSNISYADTFSLAVSLAKAFEE